MRRKRDITYGHALYQCNDAVAHGQAARLRPGDHLAGERVDSRVKQVDRQVPLGDPGAAVARLGGKIGVIDHQPLRCGEHAVIEFIVVAHRAHHRTGL